MELVCLFLALTIYYATLQEADHTILRHDGMATSCKCMAVTDKRLKLPLYFIFSFTSGKLNNKGQTKGGETKVLPL